MVPGGQNGLEEDRECADQRKGSPPPLPSATEPNPDGEVHPHLDLYSPPVSAGRSGQEASGRRYSITVMGNLRTPFSRKRGVVLS